MPHLDLKPIPTHLNNTGLNTNPIKPISTMHISSPTSIWLMQTLTWFNIQDDRIYIHQENYGSTLSYCNLQQVIPSTYGFSTWVIPSDQNLKMCAKPIFYAHNPYMSWKARCMFVWDCNLPRLYNHLVQNKLDSIIWTDYNPKQTPS